MRFLKYSFFVIFCLLLLNGCKPEVQIILKSIHVDESSIVDIEIDNFNVEDIKLILVYSDLSTEKLPLTENMISVNDLNLLKKVGTHTITVNYLELTTNFTITIKESIIEIPSYDITFDCNGGNPIDSINILFHDSIKLPLPTKDNYVFKYWEYNNEIIDGEEFYFNYNNDITLKAVWEEHEKFIVKFYNDDNSLLKEETVYYQKNATAPESPSKLGYSFLGWNQDFDKVESDLNIFPLFEVNKYILTLKVDNAIINTYTLTYGSIVKLPIPVKNNYTFDCWTLNNESFSDAINYNYDEDITLIGIWDQFEYTVDDYDNVTLLSYYPNPGEKDLVIPSTIKGYSVKFIADNFRLAGPIENLTIPNSIVSIGEYAFSKSNIKQVIFEEGSALTTIKKGAFANTKMTTITLPKNVSILESSVFTSSAYLEEVIFESQINLTSISQYLFYNCASLKTITIPYSVSNIDFTAFLGCSSLENINVEEQNTNYKSIDGILYNKTLTVLIKYPQSKNETNFVIPESVETITPRAFEGNEFIENVTFSNNVKTIGDLAFNDCLLLEIVNITSDSHLNTMGSYIFKNTAIRTIYVPKEVTVIKSCAFQNVSLLEEINVDANNNNYYSSQGIMLNKQMNYLIKYPEGNVNISYVIPSSVTLLDNNSFSNLVYLKTLLISSNVVNISNSTFFNTKSLEIINVEVENQYFQSVDGILYNKSLTELIKYPENNSEIQFVIPNTITKISYNAFKNLKYLQNISFEENSLLNIIGVDQFGYNESLVSITIPSSIQSIENLAFYGCKNLHTVIIEKELTAGLIILNNDVFEKCSSNLKIYVPTSALEGYKNAYKWYDLRDKIYSIEDKS